MSILQHIYDLQQKSNNINDLYFDYDAHSPSITKSIAQSPNPNTTTPLKSWWAETATTESAMNQREQIAPTSMNHATIAESTTESSTGSKIKALTIGLILGILVVGNALAVVVVLWQRSGSQLTMSSTNVMGFATLINAATISTTTTTSTTTTSSTSTTTETTTSTTSTTTTTTTTTSTTISTTTTTAPPSTLCVYTTNKILTNYSFIYSPTSQTYAAGMLNNQFGIYNAYGYRNVTSTAIWTANQTSTSLSCYFDLQSDRNLVVYAYNHSNSSLNVLWTAAVSNSGIGYPFCLEMLDSGNLIWIDNSTSIIWQTNTAQTG